jgi:hypothetical protein
VTAFDSSPHLRWLFCLTHPDDELAVCAWIRRLVRAGASVSLAWTHSTPEREAESRAVATRLGVCPDNLFFFRGTDGSICDELGALLPEFRRLVRYLGPDRIACGAFEQGHLDHDATNWLVNHSFNGPVLEFPLYRTYAFPLQVLNRFSSPAGQEILALTPEEWHWKAKIAKMYPSQTIYRILCCREAFSRAYGRPLELARTERLRFQTHFNYLRPNHPARLSRAVVRTASWRRWEAAVRRQALTPTVSQLPNPELAVRPAVLPIREPDTEEAIERVE